MSDAARVTYEEARYCRSSVAEAAERFGRDKSPDAVLDYIATYIAKHSKIWGKRRPPAELELIGPMQSKNGTFSDAASILCLRDSDATVFTGLQIDLADLQKVLQGLRIETKV